MRVYDYDTEMPSWCLLRHSARLAAAAAQLPVVGSVGLVSRGRGLAGGTHNTTHSSDKTMNCHPLAQKKAFN